MNTQRTRLYGNGSFPHAFGAVPKPEPRDGEHRERQPHDGGVEQFDLAAARTEVVIEDGAVVYFFNKIGPAFFDVQHLAGGHIELDAVEMIGKNELGHAFVGADVNAVHLQRKRGVHLPMQGPAGDAVQAVHRQPAGHFGGRTFVGGGQQEAAAVLFPAQQQPGEGNHKKEDEQRRPRPAVYLAKNAQHLSLALSFGMRGIGGARFFVIFRHNCE